MQRIDLTGKRFGLLVVRRFHSSPKSGGSKWVCKCDCGNESVAKSVNLRSGATRSCGCQQGGKTHACAVPSKTDSSKTRAYRSWVQMRTRCSNPKNRLYRFYGGRGISVCAEWDDFSVFLKDMGERPLGMTLGRRDNDLGYSKGNCRWESKKSQERNKTTTRWLEYNGERKSMSEWCEIFGLAFNVVHYRLRAGWSVERALTTPKAIRT